VRSGWRSAMFSSCRAVRLFSNDESTSAITESHPNVDRPICQSCASPLPDIQKFLDGDTKLLTWLEGHRAKLY
jgi:hypothetical protein